MLKWTGNWKFEDPDSEFNGQTGSGTAEARDEEQAGFSIKVHASQKLFGSVMEWRKFSVSGIKPEP